MLVPLEMPRQVEQGLRRRIDHYLAEVGDPDDEPGGHYVENETALADFIMTALLYEAESCRVIDPRAGILRSAKPCRDDQRDPGWFDIRMGLWHSLFGNDSGHTAESCMAALRERLELKFHEARHVTPRYRGHRLYVDPAAEPLLEELCQFTGTIYDPGTNDFEIYRILGDRYSVKPERGEVFPSGEDRSEYQWREISTFAAGRIATMLLTETFRANDGSNLPEDIIAPAQKFIDYFDAGCSFYSNGSDPESGQFGVLMLPGVVYDAVALLAVDRTRVGFAEATWGGMAD